MSAPVATLLRARPLLRYALRPRVELPSSLVALDMTSRHYVSRAHPEPVPTFPIHEALDILLVGIEERKVKRAERWERGKEKICARKGIKEDGPYRHIDETIELAVNINVDPRKPGQSLRGSLAVPHGTGKKKNVVVFTPSEDTAKEALEAGASAAGGSDLVQDILAGTVPVGSIDVSLATPDAMSALAPAARLLGPRGLMPNAKVGTIKNHNEIIEAMSDHVNATQVPYRTDKEGTVHAGIAKGSLGSEKILDNIRAFMQGVLDVKPETFGKGKKGKGGKKKGGGGGKNAKFFLSTFITSSQGKGYKVDLRTMDPTSAFFMGELPK